MPALNDTLALRFGELPKAMRRTLVQAKSCPGAKIEVDGKLYDNFSGNDYLGLSEHPHVMASAAEAIDEQGVCASASRLITGNHAGYTALEAQLNQSLGFEAACVFSTGYMANIGAISALMGKNDLVLTDKLSHACIIDGARLSGARLMRFSHNDMAHAAQILEQHRNQYENVLIVSEHVFSMDGDMAPMAELVALKKRYDAWLMIDDAHGVGVINCQEKPEVDIWAGTLSKALSSLGGYVLGSENLINYLVQHARSLLFTTGLPPSVTGAATAALQVMEQESWRAEKVMRHAQYFTQSLGLPNAQSPIIPVILGDAERAVQASKALKEAGFWVMPIRPPTVPEGRSRLRLSFSAMHDEATVQCLIDTMKQLNISGAA